MKVPNGTSTGDDSLAPKLTDRPGGGPSKTREARGPWNLREGLLNRTKSAGLPSFFLPCLDVLTKVPVRRFMSKFDYFRIGCW